MNRKTLAIICGIACIAIISLTTFFILTKNKPDNKKTKHIRNTKPVTLNSSTVLEQNDLDFSFLKLNNNEENMVYSPLSIKYAFNMLRDGACSDTKEELDKMLG